LSHRSDPSSILEPLLWAQIYASRGLSGYSSIAVKDRKRQRLKLLEAHVANKLRCWPVDPPRLWWMGIKPMEPLVPLESDDQKATRLLKEQLKELETIRGLNSKDPQFKAWRAQTKSYLQRFLAPSSPYLSTFPLQFHRNASTTDAPWGSPKATRLRQLDQEYFLSSCKTAEATIKAVLKHIEEFGVHVELPPMRPTPGRGGMQQNFLGNVTIQNQAIATDSAIQNVEHMGDVTGSSLREIAAVFKQSDELKRREVGEGLAGIEALASEIQRPEP
jgi:hypothetical protein